MSSFTFIHAADLHLDSPLTGLETYPDAPVEQLRGASRRALDNLVDLAISEQVAFVLFAGDVFDGHWKDFNTALFFAQRMSRLALFLALGLGVIQEGCQALIPGRLASVSDIALDIIGAALALWMFHLLQIPEASRKARVQMSEFGSSDH